MSTLRDERVRAVLERLHGEARRDWRRFPPLLPRVVAGWLRGRRFDEVVRPESLRDAYLAVPPEEGRFLYLTARMLRARRVVEFGSSFGISTLYLAAAVRDNGGGLVIGSEIEPGKHERAAAHLKEAGLEDVADIRLGDALQTLADLPEPIDLVFLDGWKDLYLPVLKLVTPRLRPGSLVLADNIHTFRTALRPYVEYVQSGANGFDSATLSISDGVEYSLYLG